jgi:putative ABC transport system permease protein
MATLSANMRRAYPDAMKGASRGLTVMSFRGWLVGDVQLNLLLVFGAVCVLLLISCANLASLLLARLTHRKQEIAMRLALGCSRGRLLQQFLLENMLLAAAGGLGGWLCARTLLVVLVALIPFRLTTVAPIRLDGLVLMFTVAVALATGLALSLVPILSTSRLALSDVLKAGGRSSGWASRQRMRTALVVSEVALSVTLLVTAGLLMQSLYRLRQERLGFNPQGLTTFTTPFGAEHRGNARDLWRYESTLLQRLQAIPGVRTVAAINVLPLTGFANLPTEQDGRPEHSNGAMEVRIITPAYFEALGIPLRLGRWFLASDTAASSSVILINETLARQWWVGGNPLGDRVVIGRFRGRDFGHPTPREVVGVVADTKTTYLNQPPRPTVYIPAAQMSDAPDHTAWVLRGSGSNDLAGNVRRAIAEIDSRQRVGDIQSMEAIVTSTTSNSRFDAWLFGLLAGLALVLVVVGVYGILSFSVARRTYEIGTRMALGASRAQVMRLVLDEGFRLIAIGLVAGLAGALIVTRFLTTLLFGVRPSDPSSFLAVSVLLLGVGVLASYFPARRATKVDPMVALRAE